MCLSPELLRLYNLEEKIVVVVDILRATSCIVTALANGVSQITTFAHEEACFEMRRMGFIVAGERNGEKLEGFDLGNSPLSYLDDQYCGEKVAMTTTNGTVALEASKYAKNVVIGAFLNINKLVDYLKSQKEDIVVLCAGWKGKVNLEDTLFAGALVHAMKDKCELECDAPQLSESAWLMAKDDLLGYLSTSSHVKRLKRLNIKKDIEFCLTLDKYEIVPVLRGDYIVRNI